MSHQTLTILPQTAFHSCLIVKYQTYFQFCIPGILFKTINYAWKNEKFFLCSYSIYAKLLFISTLTYTERDSSILKITSIISLSIHFSSILSWWNNIRNSYVRIIETAFDKRVLAKWHFYKKNINNFSFLPSFAKVYFTFGIIFRLQNENKKKILRSIAHFFFSLNIPSMNLMHPVNILFFIRLWWKWYFCRCGSISKDSWSIFKCAWVYLHEVNDINADLIDN